MCELVRRLVYTVRYRSLTCKVGLGWVGLGSVGLRAGGGWVDGLVHCVRY